MDLESNPPEQNVVVPSIEPEKKSYIKSLGQLSQGFLSLVQRSKDGILDLKKVI